MSSSFAHMATATANTKRSPSVSGGKRGDPVANLTGIAITPLAPVDAEIRAQVALNSPYELLQTFTDANDVREGDFLTVGSKDYPVRSVADWTWITGAVYRHVIVEDMKR